MGCYEDELRASWPVPRRVNVPEEGSEPYAVPYCATPIEVDANPAEWRGIARAPLRRIPEGDFLRLCWREDGLYALAEVHTEQLAGLPDLPWLAEHLDIAVEPDLSRDSVPMEAEFRFTISPRKDLETGEAQISVPDVTQRTILLKGDYLVMRTIGDDYRGVRARWAHPNDIYRVEFFIPAESLTGKPLHPGSEMGLEIVQSMEQWGRDKQSFAAPATPYQWQRIRLAR
jgi:hypothetical protein